MDTMNTIEGRRNGPDKLQDRRALYQQIKQSVHRQLIDRLDLGLITDANKESVKSQVRPVVMELIAAQPAAMNGGERKYLADEVLDEVFGFGPLEPLLKDPDISDILINNSREVYIEKRGKLYRSEAAFRDDAHLLQILDRIVSRVGRRVDETSPMVDARLPDGSRVNAIIPPLALDGPVVSIRRFGVNPLLLGDLLEKDSIIPEMVELMEGAVRSKMNVLITGGTGSGKTTLLNILSSFIPTDERIITIEDSAELILQQPHVVRLETRPPNIEGQGAITQRELLFNSLRMRPDRIVVGEVRGAEALDMLQAMNTGHDGSLTTIHANSPRDALSRIEMMVSMSGIDIPVRVVRQQIASAINLVIQTNRLSDGTRRVTSISEIVGMEGEVVSMQEIYRFEQRAVDKEGRVHGAFMATGVRPKCVAKLEAAGINLAADIFYPEDKCVVGDK